MGPFSWYFIVIAFPNPGNGVPGVYLDPQTPGSGMGSPFSLFGCIFVAFLRQMILLGKFFLKLNFFVQKFHKAC